MWIEALLDNFFDRSSYLYEEPGNLLKQALREPAIYNAIIKAIAEGASRMNDIRMRVGEENAVASKYLKTLIDLGIIRKETPITEKPGKRTIYLLADNFFRFWYQCANGQTSSYYFSQAIFWLFECLTFIENTDDINADVPHSISQRYKDNSVVSSPESKEYFCSIHLSEAFENVDQFSQ